MVSESDSWRKNLYAIAVGQFVVQVGFNMGNPFLALFIQQLGNFSNTDAAFWTGIAVGGCGLATCVSSPIWGIISDRWGRKPMLLRAQLGSAVVLALIGLSPNVPYLIGMRWLQGVLSGTIGAASALAAISCPRNKLPFAMGLIMVTIFGGQTLGPLLGGFMADSLGYRTTFFITSALLLSGGLVVLFLVHERFEPAPAKQRTSLGDIWRLATSRKVFPLLITLWAICAGIQMISPIVPLFMRELNPTGNAASESGLALFFLGALATISALAAGRSSSRFGLKKVVVYSSLVTGLLYLPPIWAGTVGQLTIFVALTGLLQGGAFTSVNSLVGLSAPANKQGIVYGIAQSAIALGSGLGPLIGGTLASYLGLRPVFAVAAALFVLVSIMVTKLFAE